MILVTYMPASLYNYVNCKLTKETKANFSCNTFLSAYWFDEYSGISVFLVTPKMIDVAKFSITGVTPLIHSKLAERNP